MIRACNLPLFAVVLIAVGPAGIDGQLAPFPRLVPRPPDLQSKDFRLAATDTLPEVESYQQVVFSGSVSGIPKDEGLDRATAPPFTVLLRQSFALFERSSGGAYFAGEVSGGAVLRSPAALVWEPGCATISTETSLADLKVEQVALRDPQGFVLRVTVRNPGPAKRTLVLATAQQPVIRRPQDWAYKAQWPTVTDPAARATADADLVVHAASDGAVAFGLDGATSVVASSAKEAIENARGAKTGGEGEGSALYRSLELGANQSRTLFVVIAFGASRDRALSSARALLAVPEGAIIAARKAMNEDIHSFLTRLPALSHPNPRVVRFYHQAALQLLYDRWHAPGTFILDPWYPTLGLDSGGMNAYAWDLSYSAIPLTLLDPDSMRKMLVALLAAPITEHYSIEPLRGTGSGPFYSYSPYAFTSAVDQYIRATGDRTILRERMKGKTVLDWLIDLAQLGETDRDPDHNQLLDYGDDHNLLEIKTTGNGPGYIHEVPSPNAERCFVYETLADLLEEEHDIGHAALIPRFRQTAADVRRAINRILWLEDVGWYGTRQKDGTVAPVYSIQVFDLLRIPGVVPPERARRLVAHLNDAEFLGPWGVRSLSVKDRLWDWRDHDWSGPMSYIGDEPQIVADLFRAGLPEEAWKVFDRFLWWPEHLAVFPQGIANDDYTSRFPQSKLFGGRIAAGRTNEISGCVGVEAIIRGLFGVAPERDGSIGFSTGRLPSDGPAALAYPFRGRTWTVTQRQEGLDVVRDDGLGATLSREDGSLWFCSTDKELIVRASTRSGGRARLTIANQRKWRSVQVGGITATPRRSGNELVLDLDDTGGAGVEVHLSRPAR